MQQYKTLHMYGKAQIIKLTGAINHLCTLHINDIAESGYTKGPGGTLFRVKTNKIW